MINEQDIINDIKNGETSQEISAKYHITYQIVSSIRHKLNLPSAKIIRKVNSDEWEEFRQEFKDCYNKCDSMIEFNDIMINHPFFEGISEKSIYQRISEIRSLLNLPCKMNEIRYDNDYDRIRGYMIRNTKFMAKRRGIFFDLKYTDFEVPTHCPILGVKLTYLHESDGNDPFHASLDRIDNSKGYIKGNVIVISKLANAMKNSANFDQLESFCKNMQLLVNYVKTHGTLGSISDVFEFTPKNNINS